MSFEQFIDSYLAHLIAVLALAQVWVIAGYKRWILRGTIEFYPTANMEVGFSAFGATNAYTQTGKSDRSSFRFPAYDAHVNQKR